MCQHNIHGYIHGYPYPRQACVKAVVVLTCFKQFMALIFESRLLKQDNRALVQRSQLHTCYSRQVGLLQSCVLLFVLAFPAD